MSLGAIALASQLSGIARPAPHTFGPTVIAPATAIAFVLLGASLLAKTTSRAPAGDLCAVAAMVCISAGLGSTALTLARPAYNTVLAFLLLGTASLLLDRLPRLSRPSPRPPR